MLMIFNCIIKEADTAIYPLIDFSIFFATLDLNVTTGEISLEDVDVTV